MKTRKTFSALLMLTMLGSLFSIAVMAQSAKKVEPIAAIPFEKNGALVTDKTEIKWKISAEYALMVLTVSMPDGEVLRQEFKPDSALAFKLSDEKGAPLPDGQYIYELRLIPKLDSEVTEALAALREREDQQASRELAVEGESQEKSDSAATLRELRKSGKLPKEALVHSGAFLIEKGVVFMGSSDDRSRTGIPGANKDPKISQQRQSFELEPLGRNRAIFMPAVMGTFDQVIPDDLIVQASLCVGFDCVNNESFGFDTIRLKENNLRIKFEDTSVGAFPTNDWQLTANDSASGGASKFSIEDITGARVPFTITAGAPTNSLFVDSSGRVGLGTSTPVLEMHIANGDSPAHRLEQTGSSGFTPQTWDIAGNEANFFVRDVTSGSRLPFRIRPGAPTSSLDIAATGKVGIGTAGPVEKLHVAGENNTNAIFEGGAATHSLVQFRNSTTVRGFIGFANVGTTGLGFFNAAGSTVNMLITDNGRIGIGVTTPTQNIQHSSGATLTGAVWTNGSSRSLKTNIQNLSSRDAFATLRGLNPVTYRYKSEPSESFVGFIAEDVPEMVATNDHKGLSPMDIVAVLTKVVQEQQQTIAELKVKVDQLEKANLKKARSQKKR